MDNRPWIILRMAKLSWKWSWRLPSPLSLSPFSQNFVFIFRIIPAHLPPVHQIIYTNTHNYTNFAGVEKKETFWKLRAPKLELMFLFEMRDQLEVTIVVFRQKIQQTIKKTIFWSYISRSIKDECKLTSLQKCWLCY